MRQAGNQCRTTGQTRTTGEQMNCFTSLSDIESRLYQNLKRYPSDFELPGGDEYQEDEEEDGDEERETEGNVAITQSSEKEEELRER